MTGPFAGRAVLVTGGARGQGAAEVRLFAERGASVLACDVLQEDGEALARDLAGEGHDVRFRRLDVTDADDWAAAAAALEAWRGRIDVLVNNAGVINRTTLVDTVPEAFARVLQINLTGAFLGIRAVVPIMRRHGGSIVNIASNSAHSGHYDPAYTASKWGLRGLTKSAAMELVADGIRVNSVSPGLVVTGLNAGSPHLEPMIAITPMRRAGSPTEVAALVAFLAGDEAAFVTGEDFVIDGGFTAGAAYRRVATETGIFSDAPVKGDETP